MTPPIQVSVIIPTYHMAAPLEECLRSVFCNEGVTIEVIVCDGAGDEATQAVIAQYEHHSLVYLQEADAGVYDAMNKGIDRSSGEWLYFLGADDQLANKNSLAHLLSGAPNNTRLILGRVKNLPPRHRRVPEWHIPKWGKALLLKNTVHHQGALYHCSLFNNYRYPTDLRILGDYHLNLTLYNSETPAHVTDIHVASCAQGGLSKRFEPSLYREEWRLKRAILPLGSTWWQPLWLIVKYLRKRFT